MTDKLIASTQKAVAEVRNASGLAHTAVLLLTIAVGLYHTVPAYHAQVLTAWAHMPHWIKTAGELVIPPALIYWNSRKAEAPDAGK